MRRSARRRGEDGAVALMTVFLSLVIFGVAAIAIDIATLAMQRQKLHDAVDAAAHAGAFAMPGDGASAIAAARSIAFANDPDLAWDFTQQNPKIRLWCVVASNGQTPPGVQAPQIGSTCNPGAGPYDVSKYPDLRCNGVICKIPCAPSPTTSCNTVEVVAEKEVPFGFANVFGDSEGSTGSVASAACKGSCGAEAPNPMDIVIMADRTYSMSTTNRRAMVDGIESALRTMNPAMHYVALGALHKSEGTNASCMTSPWPEPRAQGSRESDSAYDTFIQGEVQKGKWVPVPFSNNYLVTGASTPTLNSTSVLARSVSCIRSTYSPIPYRTHLASALKGASRYLLGKDPNNLASLPTDRPGVVKKAIIFETDGKPQEILNKNSTGLGLNTAGDMGVGGESNSQISQACKNFTDIATQTKNDAQKPIIITIGFGDANTATCGSSTTTRNVRDALAAAASPHPVTGAASKAESDCSTTAEKTAENGDGDYYYCASNGSELGPIFQTALTSLSGGIKLVKLPR
jgi:hypothetical protein